MNPVDHLIDKGIEFLSKIRFQKKILIGFQLGLLFSLTAALVFAQDSQPINTPSDKPIIIQVKSIDFTIKKNGIDMVMISLNQPAAINLFALDHDAPKVVVDIQNVLEWKGSEKIQVNGRCIKQLRIHLHKDQKKLRAVIDLVNPAKEYLVSPFYNENTNVYRLEIQEK
jgi:hypothetical protein